MIARVTVCPRILLTKCTPRTYISRRNLFSSAVRLSDQAPSTAEVPLDSKAYSKTLLLPKTSFPLWSNPPEVENQYRSLTCDSLYRWQVQEGFWLSGSVVMLTGFRLSGTTRRALSSFCMTGLLMRMEICIWVRFALFSLAKDFCDASVKATP